MPKQSQGVSDLVFSGVMGGNLFRRRRRRKRDQSEVGYVGVTFEVMLTASRTHNVWWKWLGAKITQPDFSRSPSG